MARSRKFLTVGAVGVAALALIGAGASATFTDATTSNQQVQAGTIDLRLNSDVAIAGNYSKTITMPNVGPTNSTFKSSADNVWMTNYGTVKADAITLALSTTATNAADLQLQGQMNVCLYSDGATLWNGKVSAFPISGLSIAGPFVPMVPDAYQAEFYAGDVTTQCGIMTTPSLDNLAQGGVVGTSVTVTYVG